MRYGHFDWKLCTCQPFFRYSSYMSQTLLTVSSILQYIFNNGNLSNTFKILQAFLSYPLHVEICNTLIYFNENNYLHMPNKIQAYDMLNLRISKCHISISLHHAGQILSQENIMDKYLSP